MLVELMSQARETPEVPQHGLSLLQAQTMGSPAPLARVANRRWNLRGYANLRKKWRARKIGACAWYLRGSMNFFSAGER